MDDLIDEFITETNESLEELDQDVLTLEQNPNDADLLSKIFRLMHTIKGTCGFLALPRLEKVAHHAENVLGRFRDGDLEVTPDYVTLIFESLDRIKFIVGEIAQKGAEPDGDDSELIHKLDVVYEGKAAEASEAEDISETSSDASGNSDESEIQAMFDAPPEAAISEGPADEEPSKPPQPETTPAPDAPNAAAPAAAQIQTTQTLRVNVDVLENLMTMVSELVLTRNQLMQIQRAASTNNFSTPLQRLNHVVSDLQDGVMQTRMQPIGNAWSKLPRIIRDLSMELGKKIDFEMRGQDTELDRQVLDLIRDPLTHMVRNSADHGIEMPEDRLAAGKSETGRVVLEAFHEGGHIIIKITDDGKGLSTEKIKAKILENGLATPEELETLSLQQIQQFIFKAGLSTAEEVTSVSGRGVGMDVVRSNIEKIGGSVELTSKEGEGSVFTIKIPLTLAIISALILESGGERFAIPQLSVKELVMASEHGQNKIEMIKGSPVFRLRDHLLPLVSLKDLLKLQTDSPSSNLDDTDQDDKHEDKASENGTKYIVVTQIGPYVFGIIVDQVFDTEEIVVKPVSKILRDIEIFSGNTILGDGTVIMILDPNGIARATGEIDSTDATDTADNKEKDVADSMQKTSLLLFTAGTGAPKAVPLSLVARLENVHKDKIEHSSGQFVVQYRNSLMPLNFVNSDVSFDDHEEKPVLVFSDKGNYLGLVIDDIIDIKEEHIDIKQASDQPDVLGSAIIDGKATEVIDVGHLLSTHNKEWFKDHGDEPFGEASDVNDDGKRRILLVDDSPFFRNMLTPLLSVAGYEVTSLESPIEALELCETGAIFDVIVSDIEMPDMDGFEFAEKIKSNSNWQDTPLVALSSHATEQDMNRGIEVGFNKYVAKFDRDTLLDTLSQTLSEKHASS